MAPRSLGISFGFILGEGGRLTAATAQLGLQSNNLGLEGLVLLLQPGKLSAQGLILPSELLILPDQLGQAHGVLLAVAECNDYHIEHLLR